MKNVKDFWDKISKDYDKQADYKYGETYSKTIELTKKYLSNTDIVFDYGCGTGITTVELSSCVDKIHAIDISENMIGVANNKTHKKNITNIQFEVTSIFNEKIEKNNYDVVLAFNILYFIKDIDKVIQRINELLKPNGIFISVTDCLGEKKTPMIIIQSLLSRMGLLPYMKKYKISALEEKVQKGDFSIIETSNLYKSPPNYYIVARKNG